MHDLRITLVQTSLYWENPQANLAMLEEKLSAAEEKTDLIILPEMFTTGFSMNAEKLAEPANLFSYRWMKQMAAKHDAVLTGSVIVKENTRYFNQLIWMRPDGSFSTYNKRHLFRMAEEDKTYSAGTSAIIEEVKGWKVLPLVCYDLRFPVWSRNRNNAYDLLLYVANWPASRSHAWKTLLPARAIENLCYAVGVNRVGEDGKGIGYTGDSGIWDFKGYNLLDLKDEERVSTFEISASALISYREKFPAYLDADDFDLQI
jgi:predicted amidohydrolase